MQLPPQVVVLPVRQEPEAPVRGCQAASTVWQIKICQACVGDQALPVRSSSCSWGTPNGNPHCRATYSV
eukprot:8528799-Pyramimonas_sp.AAC.1